jgi:hypothetical protein
MIDLVAWHELKLVKSNGRAPAGVRALRHPGGRQDEAST